MTLNLQINIERNKGIVFFKLNTGYGPPCYLNVNFKNKKGEEGKLKHLNSGYKCLAPVKNNFKTRKERTPDFSSTEPGRNLDNPPRMQASCVGFLKFSRFLVVLGILNYDQPLLSPRNGEHLD